MVFCLGLHAFMACILNICVAELAYFFAFCPTRVCPGFFPLLFFFFQNLKRSQRSALKFWGCGSGAAPSLF